MRLSSVTDKARSLLASLSKRGSFGPRPGAKPGPAVVGAFDQRLLAVLACPSSHEPLRYDDRTRELVAERARLAYPVVDGIPILIVGKARPLAPPLPPDAVES